MSIQWIKRHPQYQALLVRKKYINLGNKVDLGVLERCMGLYWSQDGIQLYFMFPQCETLPSQQHKHLYTFHCGACFCGKVRCLPCLQCGVSLQIRKSNTEFYILMLSFRVYPQRFYPILSPWLYYACAHAYICMHAAADMLHRYHWLIAIQLQGLI